MAIVYFTDDPEYLEHYGIKGMKWGVRRFQNEDGSLTSSGKNRYGVGADGKPRTAMDAMLGRNLSTSQAKQRAANQAKYKQNRRDTRHKIASDYGNYARKMASERGVVRSVGGIAAYPIKYGVGVAGLTLAATGAAMATGRAGVGKAISIVGGSAVGAALGVNMVRNGSAVVGHVLNERDRRVENHNAKRR